MDEFTRIRTFLKVVEAGSFSAAARDVSSASAVARQIKALEDELGVRLLNRSTRSLSLTEAGRRFHARMSVVVTEFSVAKAEVMSLQDDVKGQLRVSLRFGAGMTVIVPALPKLLEQYPELSIDITMSDEKRDLIANEIDVAVWLGEPPNLDIVARRLSASSRIVCATDPYLKRHGIPLEPQDLRQHNCLVFSSQPHHDVWSFKRNGQTEEVDVRGGISSDSSIVLLSSGAADVGLIIVQRWMVSRLLDEGKLQQVLADWEVSPRSGDAALYAVYPSSRGLSRNVRVFVDFLVALFAAENKRV